MDFDKAAMLVKAIIRGQQVIIGPLAIEQANKVPGLQVSADLSVIKVTLAPKETLTKLVEQYEKLFGRASVEACKDAVKEYLPNFSDKDLPSSLQ